MENKKQSVIGFMCTGAPDPSTFFLIFITNYARKFMQTERISVVVVVVEGCLYSPNNDA